MRKTGKILGHIAIGIAFIAALGAVVMLLWNWLLPTIFGIKTINFWQALGILTLSKILFVGGYKFGKHHGHKHHHHSKWLNAEQRRKLLEMSDQERREFLKHRFCCRHESSNQKHDEADASK